MKTYKFSIIIPIYNVENYLRKCLDSVASQTYNNFEVIIVIDKCDDNSEKIADKYIKKYNSPAGVIYMRSDGKYLTGLWFEGSRDSSKHLGNYEEKTFW